MAKRKGVLQQLAEQQPWDYEDLGVLYRYENYSVDYPAGRVEKVSLTTFRIRRKTPTGAWIDVGAIRSLTAPFLRVTFGAKRSYAYRTKEAALDSFIKRKESQIQHLKESLVRAEEALKRAQKGDVND